MSSDQGMLIPATLHRYGAIADEELPNGRDRRRATPLRYSRMVRLRPLLQTQVASYRWSSD
jgi:hypothetical protein